MKYLIHNSKKYKHPNSLLNLDEIFGFIIPKDKNVLKNGTYCGVDERYAEVRPQAETSSALALQ